MSNYQIEFEFQTDDPLLTMIVDDRGYQRLRIFEDPIPKTVEFSWNASDWEPGVLSKKVVDLLNSNR